MKLETTSEFDLIGQNITITNSKNNEIVGFGGMVVMETKNMVILYTENGEKKIPKNICQFSNENGIIDTDASKLNKRPHERLEMLV